MRFFFAARHFFCFFSSSLRVSVYLYRFHLICATFDFFISIRMWTVIMACAHTNTHTQTKNGIEPENHSDGHEEKLKKINSTETKVERERIKATQLKEAKNMERRRKYFTIALSKCEWINILCVWYSNWYNHSLRRSAYVPFYLVDCVALMLSISASRRLTNWLFEQTNERTSKVCTRQQVWWTN